MDSEKNIHDLNRRFSALLPEFYKRRIVVWADADTDKMIEIDLDYEVKMNHTIFHDVLTKIE